MIHIEMSLAKDGKDAWDLRVGDLDNCDYIHNATKDIVLEIISKEMDTHMEAVLDK